MRVGEGACACFWLEATQRVRLSLRRFTFPVGPNDEGKPAHRDCPAGTNGCDATVWLDVEIPRRMDMHDDGYRTMRAVPKSRRPPKKDPRWPKVCEACGQPFERGDIWQVNQAEIYVRSDTGAEVAHRGHGGVHLAGALYDAWWLHNRVIRDQAGVERRYVGPDGIALVAVCPNGLPWEVDGPSRPGDGSLGPGWTRTGDPRHPETLSVTPSIIAGEPGAPTTYHGHLTGGRFTAHIG